MASKDPAEPSETGEPAEPAEPEEPEEPEPKTGLAAALAKAAAKRAAAAERPAEPPPGYVSDFFEHLFGFKERDFSYAEVQARFAVEDAGRTLLSSTNGRRFRMGSFTCPTLGELREAGLQFAGEAPRSLAASGEARPPLTVRHVLTKGAMEDHADPENAGALFQVASQFNCLEFTSKAGTPENGVSVYARDPTQGPACAIACAPGTVYRNYLLPLPQADGPERLGQTGGLQLDTLDGVARLLGNCEEPDPSGRGRYFWLENGYVVSDRERLRALSARLESLGEEGRDELRAALKVGFTFEAEVVVRGSMRAKRVSASSYFLVAKDGAAAGGSESSSEPRCQVVSQVYSAALNVVARDTDVADWEPFARLILEATYEAALWAAVRNARRQAAEAGRAGAAAPRACHRVVLTLVGGGVFGNQPEWIAEAINRALAVVAAAAPPGGWGVEVCVAHFRSISPGLEECVRLGAPPRLLPWTCAACSGEVPALEKCKRCNTRRPPLVKISSG